VIYNPTVRRLWTAANDKFGNKLSGVGNKLSDNQSIDLREVCDLGLYVAIGGATGTTPTLDVGLDVKDPDGNWYLQVLKITQITGTAAAVQSASAGLHLGGTGALVLPEYGRISITLGGTNPAYTGVSITLFGR